MDQSKLDQAVSKMGSLSKRMDAWSDEAREAATAARHKSVGQVAEDHGYKKTGSKTYSLNSGRKRWSAIAGTRNTDTYHHPETGHSITVKEPNWKHNFAKSGGNSKSGVGSTELHEHLTSRRKS